VPLLLNLKAHGAKPRKGSSDVVPRAGIIHPLTNILMRGTGVRSIDRPIPADHLTPHDSAIRGDWVSTGRNPKKQIMLIPSHADRARGRGKIRLGAR
jgi:hypothetical protein